MSHDNIAIEPFAASPFKQFHYNAHRPTLDLLQLKTGCATIASAVRLASGVVATLPASTLKRWAQQGMSQEELALFGQLDAEWAEALRHEHEAEHIDAQEEQPYEFDAPQLAEVDQGAAAPAPVQVVSIGPAEELLAPIDPNNLTPWAKAAYRRAKKKLSGFGSGTRGNRFALALLLMRSILPERRDLEEWLTANGFGSASPQTRPLPCLYVEWAALKLLDVSDLPDELDDTPQRE